MDVLAELGPLALASRLKRLADGLMQDGIRVYQDSGVEFEPRWFPVYYYLSRSGPSAVTEIARGLGVSHPAVNQVAKELIGANILATYKDRRDKRKRVLALTRHGKLMLPALESVWREIRSSLQEVVDAAGPDFLVKLAAVEGALADKTLHHRFVERYQPGRLAAIDVGDLTRDDVAVFRSLNEAWIEEHFGGLEEADRRMLEDPWTYVIDDGGSVLVARDRDSGQILGTCALINRGEGMGELAKMTVARSARGLGIGKLIARGALERARKGGFRTLYLETNSSLTPALRLYEALGFVRKPSPFRSDYARADVYMEFNR